MPARRHIFRLLISAVVSVFVLAVILRMLPAAGGEVSGTMVWDAVRQVSLAAVGLYFLCQLLQTLFRALRYRVLLKGDGEAGVPGLGRMTLVTFARNMFVDLVPARAGELTYVAMLNRGYRVSGEACLSSLTVSMLFDFLALWLVLAGSLLAPVLQSGARGYLGAVLIMLTLVILAGWICLFYLPGPLLKLARRILGKLASWKPMATLLDFAAQVVESLERVRRSGRLGSVLGLSALVRIFKYLGLVVLFRGVAVAVAPDLAGAPVWTVLVTLVSAEGGASLPVPSFMSFGTYEAGGVAALGALGFAAGQAAVVLLAMHIVSQVIDYTLGGLAMIAFSWTVSAAEAPPSTDRAPLLLKLAGVGLLMAVGAGSLLLGAKAWLTFKRSSEREPPGVGALADDHAAGMKALAQWAEPYRGFVVWSSNRTGNHEIHLRTLPDLQERRLTDNGFTDTYPRISPDGKQIVFCRSKLPYVSQRDPVPWDVFRIDLTSGKEQLVAEDGNTPTWSRDGSSIIFQRAAGQVVQHRLEDGEETVLVASGEGSVPPGLQLQTPDYYHPAERLAVTVRGRKRGTWIIGPGDQFVQVGGGCQLAWADDGSFLYYIDHGGKMQNRVTRVDPETVEQSPWLDLPEPYSHEYFPKLARNPRLLALGASAEGHEHDRADYEIFLWQPGTPAEQTARFTFHTGNDGWPDVFVE